MKVACSLTFAMLAGLCAGPAMAANERHYALVVGYNGRPETAEAGQRKVLRFADDDALAFAKFAQELGDEVFLLTLVDAETDHRLAKHLEPAGPPTLTALDAAVEKLRDSMTEDLAKERTPVFTFYFSGHGIRDPDGKASLMLWDGALSRTGLYERVLDRIPAKVVHLILDACHAESVVAPRDATAATEKLTAKDAAAAFSQLTLDRYPHVGLAVASSSDADAHEWDEFQSGVFTHQLLSGLRGAADVNGDATVEYSEIAAFLSAANYAIRDPRARLHAIVKPPASSPHASLSDLRRIRPGGRLFDIPASVGRFFVEDEDGTRLLDGHAEPGFAMSVVLPAQRRLHVSNGEREAELYFTPAAERSYASLEFRSRPSRNRGALETSLRAGVFATPFGPAFYRGFVGQNEEVSVVFPKPLPRADLGAPPTAPAGPVATPSRPLRWSLGILSGGLLVSSAVFGVLAWDAQRDYDRAVTPAEAVGPSERLHRDSIAAVSLGISGLVTAGIFYLLTRQP